MGVVKNTTFLVDHEVTDTFQKHLTHILPITFSGLTYIPLIDMAI